MISFHQFVLQASQPIFIYKATDVILSASKGLMSLLCLFGPNTWGNEALVFMRQSQKRPIPLLKSSGSDLATQTEL